MLLTRKAIVEPYPLPDLHGEITCMEALPGFRARVWICQNRGTKFQAVAKVVLDGWHWIGVRPDIGRWMAAHRFHEPPPIFIH